MTLSEFEKWLAIFIVEVYHQRVHSSLKMSLIRKYEEGVFGTENKPGTRLPARITDEDRLRLDFMPYIERTIQGYGVVIDEIHYYHDVLRRFINAKDRKILNSHASSSSNVIRAILANFTSSTLKSSSITRFLTAICPTRR